jgi:hypothetical protein
VDVAAELAAELLDVCPVPAVEVLDIELVGDDVVALPTGLQGKRLLVSYIFNS